MKILKEIMLSSNYNIDKEQLEKYFVFLSENATTEPPYEKHHILPRSLFPEHIKNKHNLIKLKPKDHFIAHYLLAKAVKENEMFITIQMMTSIFSKYKLEQHDLEYLSNLYEEMRSKFYGLVNVRFEDGSTRIISNTHEDYISGKCVPVQTGTQRSEQAILNFKKCNNPEVKGYPYHDPITLKTKYFKREDAPKGWISGPPVAINSGKPNSSWYHNPETQKQARLFPEEVTDGWLKGRINFGQENPFKTGIYFDPINKKGVSIPKEIPVPKFYHNMAQKYYYFWTKDNEKLFSPKTPKISSFDFVLEIQSTNFNDELFNEYNWNYVR